MSSPMSASTFLEALMNEPGKVDPRGFTMDYLRARIHDRLT
ncbi:hypothetical protein [Streptomyces sp. NPDC048411]